MKINFKFKKNTIQYIGFSIIIIALIFVMYSFFSYQMYEYNTIEGMDNLVNNDTTDDTTDDTNNTSSTFTAADETELERLETKQKKDKQNFDGDDRKKMDKLKAKRKIRDEQEIEQVQTTKNLNSDLRQKIKSIDNNIEGLKDDTAFAKNKDLYMKYLSKAREEKVLQKMQNELMYVNDNSSRQPFKNWSLEELGDLEVLLATDKVRPASEYT